MRRALRDPRLGRRRTADHVGSAVAADGSRRAGLDRRTGRPRRGAPLDIATMSPPNSQAPGPPPRNPNAGGAVATLPPTQTPNDEYDLAYGYVLRKDYALAEDSFRTFLSKYPSDRLRRRRHLLARRKPVPAPALSRRRRSLPQRLDQVRNHRQGAGRAAAARAVARGARREGSGLRVARRSHAQISARLRGREAGRRAGTEACPLLRRRRSPPAEAKTLFDRSLTLPSSFSRSPAVRIRPRCCCWRRAGAPRASTGPKLLAVTVDHGLRPRIRARGARGEAARAPARRRAPHAALARRQAGDRLAGGRARRALPAARGRCRAAKARHVVTAHTLDDQAETVLFRMARGSGLTGLAAMAHASPLPVGGGEAIVLVRPLLDIPKARLIATLEQAKIDFADDPSNRDPRFTRPRLRDVMPALGARGARCAPLRAAGAAPAARRCGDRDRGRRGGESAVAGGPGPIAARSSSMPKNSPTCPPKWRCACSAARLRRLATRGRSSSASSRRSIEALESANRHEARSLAPHAGGRAGHADRDHADGRARARAQGRRTHCLNHRQIWRARSPQTAVE